MTRRLHRVLLVHNAYQHRGGEDSVVASELALLRSQGHEVDVLSRHNDDIAHYAGPALVADTFWSRRTLADLSQKVEALRPDVIHVHNTFPLVSPSIYWGAARHGIPVVQTLHNFRLMCVQAMYLRDGKVCEDCAGRSMVRGVLRGCYRGSRAQSAVLGAMVSVHRAMGTWRDKVAAYIALNGFCRNKFIEGGLPADRIVIKPNFVDAPPLDATLPRAGYLFVGRLSPEKGVGVLAEAARLRPHLNFRVAGSGSDEALLAGLPNVTLLGSLSADAVREEMLKARALLLPSIWYENFPRTVVEAYAAGLPVVASRLGALPEIVVDGETGLLFAPGDAVALAQSLDALEHSAERVDTMSRTARTAYDLSYTPASNYSQLQRIYQSVAAL